MQLRNKPKTKIEIYRKEVALSEDAQALDYLLSLDVPAKYRPDLVKSWLGMQVMEHCQLDPCTLFLLLMEECEIMSNTVH